MVRWSSSASAKKDGDGEAEGKSSENGELGRSASETTQRKRGGSLLESGWLLSVQIVMDILPEKLNRSGDDGGPQSAGTMQPA